jgi:hypothetical protein
VTYLEFYTLDDYLEHLRSHGVKESRLDYRDVIGKPDKHGVAAVAVLAVATAKLSDHIAIASVKIGSTLSVFVKHPDDRHREWQESVKQAFEAVKRRIEADKIAVLPGIHSIDPPSYLDTRRK